MTSKDGTGHDDDELDQMMGSMRSMWRDMPDEEPPSHGLDALMAAARTKAAEMKPPEKQESWFRRALAMLARPPVLAAATVVVLVGSTVLLTQRDGGERAATPTTRTFDDEAPGRPANLRAQSADDAKESSKGGDRYDGAGSAAPPAAQLERPARPRPAIVPRPTPQRDVKPSDPAAHPAPAPPPPPPPPVAAADAEQVVKDKPAVKQSSEDRNAPAADSIAIETTGGSPAPASARPPTVSPEQLL